MLKLYPSVINGNIKAPASEEHAQLLMFASSLGASPAKIYNMPDCSGVDTCMECLGSMGCRFSTDEYDFGALVVDPYVKTMPIPEISFNFRDCAAAARYAVPLAAVMGLKADCTASSGLIRRRRMVTLTSRLALRGASFSNFSLPFEMKGRIGAGEYKFSGDDDPQFISALMLSLPLLRGDSDIVFESPQCEDKTVAMTVKELQRFGICMEKTEKGWHIPGAQTYGTVEKLKVANDWMLSDIWTAAGAFCASKGGRVQVEELSPEMAGMAVDASSVFSLLSQNFLELNLDCSRYPRLAAVFAAAAAVKGAAIHLSGLSPIHHGYDDMFKSLDGVIDALGAERSFVNGVYSVTGDPGTSFSDRAIDCQGDPWVFISLCACAGLLREPLIISDEQGADSIYRNFLKDLRSLGGCFEIV